MAELQNEYDAPESDPSAQMIKDVTVSPVPEGAEQGSAIRTFCFS